MKKIVGIIAALAMAGAVFAADISAKVELDGNLLKYNGTTEGLTALNVDKPSDQHWNAVFSTSVSGDNAGASFVVMSGNSETNFGWNKQGKTLAGRNWQIWMKPADALKFTIGKIDSNLNQEQITWSQTAIKVDSNGFGINIGIDAISVDLMFTPDLGNDWMKDAKTLKAADQAAATDGDAEAAARVAADDYETAIGQTTIKLGYGADFGNIGLWFQGNDSFKSNTIAVGYSNNFGDVFAFLNAGATLVKDMDPTIRVEAFAKGNVDAFGWAIWVPVDVDLNLDEDNLTLGTILELTYALDGATGYFRLNDGNFLADDFAAEFRIGAKGSVGGAGWNIWAQIDVAEKTNFSVPFEFSYGF